MRPVKPSTDGIELGHSFSRFQVPKKNKKGSQKNSSENTPEENQTPSESPGLKPEPSAKINDLDSGLDKQLPATNPTPRSGHKQLIDNLLGLFKSLSRPIFTKRGVQGYLSHKKNKGLVTQKKGTVIDRKAS